jgi:hypothetical protein
MKGGVIMGIDVYLTVVFWMTIAGVTLKTLRIMIKTYPYKEEKTLGLDLVCLLLSIFFLVWVIYLKF